LQCAQDAFEAAKEKRQRERQAREEDVAAHQGRTDALCARLEAETTALAVEASQRGEGDDTSVPSFVGDPLTAFVKQFVSFCATRNPDGVPLGADVLAREKEALQEQLRLANERLRRESRKLTASEKEGADSLESNPWGGAVDVGDVALDTNEGEEERRPSVGSRLMQRLSGSKETLLKEEKKGAGASADPWASQSRADDEEEEEEPPKRPSIRDSEGDFDPERKHRESF